MIYSDLAMLQQDLQILKNQGKTIVWTNGCFDILHPGHIETFRKAHEYGDVLVVGLNGDASPYWKTKPGRPINDENHRSQLLQAIRFVDVVFIYDDETPLVPIQELLPDILIKGGDYKAEEVVGYQEIIDNGGKIIIIPTVEGYSTTNIVNKMKTI